MVPRRDVLVRSSDCRLVSFWSSWTGRMSLIGWFFKLRVELEVGMEMLAIVMALWLPVWANILLLVELVRVELVPVEGSDCVSEQ